MAKFILKQKILSMLIFEDVLVQNQNRKTSGHSSEEIDTASLNNLEIRNQELVRDTLSCPPRVYCSPATANELKSTVTISTDPYPRLRNETLPPYTFTQSFDSQEYLRRLSSLFEILPKNPSIANKILMESTKVPNTHTHTATNSSEVGVQNVSLSDRKRSEEDTNFDQLTFNEPIFDESGVSVFSRVSSPSLSSGTETEDDEADKLRHSSNPTPIPSQPVISTTAEQCKMCNKLRLDKLEKLPFFHGTHAKKSHARIHGEHYASATASRPLQRIDVDKKKVFEKCFNEKYSESSTKEEGTIRRGEAASKKRKSFESIPAADDYADIRPSTSKRAIEVIDLSSGTDSDEKGEGKRKRKRQKTETKEKEPNPLQRKREVDVGVGGEGQTHEYADGGGFVVRCHCTLNSQIGGRMIQCDRCDAWQHTICMGVGKKLPEVYQCEKCRPRRLPLSSFQAKAKQIKADRIAKSRRSSAKRKVSTFSKNRSHKLNKRPPRMTSITTAAFPSGESEATQSAGHRDVDPPPSTSTCKEQKEAEFLGVGCSGGQERESERRNLCPFCPVEDQYGKPWATESNSKVLDHHITDCIRERDHACREGLGECFLRFFTEAARERHENTHK